MIKYDPEKIQAEIEKKTKKRLQRKRPKMKVSGAGVKNLQRLIIKKSKLDK